MSSFHLKKIKVFKFTKHEKTRTPSISTEKQALEKKRQGLFVRGNRHVIGMRTEQDLQVKYLKKIPLKHVKNRNYRNSSCNCTENH